MAAILTGRDRLFARWAAKRIPQIGTFDRFGKCVAVGVATGPKANDRLMAVVVFHDYYPEYRHCQLSIAAIDPHWVSRKTVKALLAIPFYQYNCSLVWVAIPHRNERVIRLGKALGFRQEAVLSDRFGEGVHAVVLRIKRNAYERLYWDRAATPRLNARPETGAKPTVAAATPAALEAAAAA